MRLAWNDFLSENLCCLLKTTRFSPKACGPVSLLPWAFLEMGECLVFCELLEHRFLWETLVPSLSTPSSPSQISISEMFAAWCEARSAYMPTTARLWLNQGFWEHLRQKGSHVAWALDSSFQSGTLWSHVFTEMPGRESKPGVGMEWKHPWKQSRLLPCTIGGILRQKELGWLLSNGSPLSSWMKLSREVKVWQSWWDLLVGYLCWSLWQMALVELSRTTYLFLILKYF